MSNVKAKLKEFLSRSTSMVELQGEEDIFALGLVHSLFAMQLILFIEREFDIEVDEDELEFDRLRTLNAISALVEQKLELQNI